MHCRIPVCVFSAPCEAAKGEMRLQRSFPPFCRWWRRSSSECFSGEKIQKRGLRAPAASDNISFAASVATHFGALAQLGERMAGSHEVRGSIPLCSTINDTAVNPGWRPFSLSASGVRSPYAPPKPSGRRGNPAACLLIRLSAVFAESPRAGGPLSYNGADRFSDNGRRASR